mgnify:CR=1 FL=1
MEEEFEELDETGAQAPKPGMPLEGAPVRARLPRQGQMVGTVTQRLGGNRMDILCSDGKTRNCRVPGRFKRSLWLRINDVVMIELWEHDPEKGDVIYKYNSSEVNQLRKRGLLTNRANEF